MTMAKTNELDVCPFCGEPATVKRHYVGQRKAQYQIGCNNCHYEHPWRPTLRRAAAEWNKRAPMPYNPEHRGAITAEQFEKIWNDDKGEEDGI